MKNALERLCEVIAYPEPVPEGATRFQLRVDGGDVTVRLVGRRLVLSRVIDREDNDLSQLAIFAAGRILKEEAVLAWDERASVCILWQDVSDNADGAELTHFFEAFMDSCDWWLARAVELNAPPVHFPDIVIRP
ncbi:MAG: hypothetical protein IJT83_11425 [Victivallales bacterium]|nr:hypothetical protein [Victivallales bacterium]MBR4221408.1 hypothetical protein [Victivallales bacterium]